jgi:hypothetical protein
MTSLLDLQRMVRDAVFETEPNGPALNAVIEHIEAGDGFTAADHLLIYRRAIIGTLVRTLGAIHPVCKKLVGDEFFDAMGRVYARQTPSESPDLGDYGKSFSTFIAGFEPAAELPYLADVARLEWCWHRAFHAPDEQGLDIAALGNIADTDTDRIAFRLAVSAHLLASDYPVQHIWQVNQDDWTGDPTIDLNEGGTRLIVWRQIHDMRIDAPDPSEWRLLNAIDAGQTLGEIGAAKDLDDLDSVLPRCVQNGWIAGFEVRTPN